MENDANADRTHLSLGWIENILKIVFIRPSLGGRLVTELTIRCSFSETRIRSNNLSLTGISQFRCNVSLAKFLFSCIFDLVFTQAT